MFRQVSIKTTGEKIYFISPELQNNKITKFVSSLIGCFDQNLATNDCKTSIPKTKIKEYHVLHTKLRVPRFPPHMRPLVHFAVLYLGSESIP